MAPPQRLYESVDAALGQRLNAAPVVHSCKILGLQSKKNRRYLPDAIAKAKDLYEGRSVYIDHPEPSKADQPRPLMAKFGTIKAVRLAADGSLLGDLHYNPHHPLTPLFEGWLQIDPNAIGLSHSAMCVVRECGDGSREIVEIKSVESVDLVTSPATTRGLFEDSHLDPLMPLGGSEPAPAPEVELGLDDAVSKLLAAILKDDTLDMAKKRKKVLTALKLLDDVDDGKGDLDEALPADEESSDDSGDEPDDKDKEVEEAVGRFEAKVGTLIQEALDRIEAKLQVKPPVSKAPVTKKPELTVDTLLAALHGSKN